MRKNNSIYAIAAIALFIVLILDTKTAVDAARDGITVCLECIIPSLLPFMILSAFLCSITTGGIFKGSRFLCRFLGIPDHAGTLLIVSVLGGYPACAKSINDCYENGFLSKRTAKRMLGFCCNAGPSFIFGMIAPQLSRPILAWLLWCIHLLASFITGCILRINRENAPAYTQWNNRKTDIIAGSIKALGSVCVWVILFRIALNLCEKWFFKFLSTEMSVMLTGILELSNGCLMLNKLQTQGAIFIIAGSMLSFGGLCVLLQTVSVTKTIGLGMYFPGKLLQTCITLLLSYFIQPFLFSEAECFSVQPMVIIAAMVTVAVITILRKKF